MHPRLKTLIQALRDAIGRHFPARTRPGGTGGDARLRSARDLDADTADLFEPEPRRALRRFGSVRGPIVAIVFVAAAAALLVTSPPFASVGRGEIGVRVNRVTGSVDEWGEGTVLVVPGVHRLRVFTLRDRSWRAGPMARGRGAREREDALHARTQGQARARYRARGEGRAGAPRDGHRGYGPRAGDRGARAGRGDEARAALQAARGRAAPARVRGREGEPHQDHGRQRAGTAHRGERRGRGALDELAAVDKAQLSDADLASHAEAAVRVGASRWSAAIPLRPTGKVRVDVVPGAPGETCVALVDVCRERAARAALHLCAGLARVGHAQSRRHCARARGAAASGMARSGYSGTRRPAG